MPAMILSLFTGVGMRSSYYEDDVTLLLKDITGLVDPLATEEREKLIQSGIHYSEMLPLEYKPTEKYIETYNVALRKFGQDTADAIERVSEKIYETKGPQGVIVSLARAGTPIGVLIHRYIKNKYDVDMMHYSISIIRGRGIDHNALNYVIDRHGANSIQFVDGWVGKGAIFKELRSALSDYPEVSASLAVVADPANITDLCGTHDDIMIASSCLNSTVSGLISRTFLREDIIGPDDFHGAAYYGELSNEDRTYEFIEYIESLFRYDLGTYVSAIDSHGYDEVLRISRDFNVADINHIKPGIGETTRVLLRRVPWRVLVSKEYTDSDELHHVYQLAKERNVEIVPYDLKNYKCCGIIKSLSDV